MGPRSRPRCVRTQCPGPCGSDVREFFGSLSTDAAPSLTLPFDNHAAWLPSPPLVSPPTFDCNISACSAYALNDADLAVSRVQTPLDTHLYDTNDACAVCSTGGTLLCCEFCNLVFHASCVPALRPHLPPDGLACVACFADSYPDQRAAYERTFYQRPLALPLSTPLDPAAVPSIVPPVLSTPPDMPLTFSRSIPTDSSPACQASLPTPRDLRASRRSEVVARSSRAATDAPGALGMVIGAATDIHTGAGAGACAGITANKAGASVSATKHVSAAVDMVPSADMDLVVNMPSCVVADAAVGMREDLSTRARLQA